MPSLDHLCTLGVLVCLAAALVLACLLERCRRRLRNCDEWWMDHLSPTWDRHLSDMARADEDNRTVPPKGGRP